MREHHESARPVRQMSVLPAESDPVNFGALPEAINNLLQQGVVAYRRDPLRADALFREALALAPNALPTYFCLYKIHTYQGNLDAAQAAAESGLSQAARQAGWGPRLAGMATASAASRRSRSFRALHLESTRLHSSAPRRPPARAAHAREIAATGPCRRRRLAGRRGARGRNWLSRRGIALA